MRPNPPAPLPHGRPKEKHTDEERLAIERARKQRYMLKNKQVTCYLGIAQTKWLTGYCKINRIRTISSGLRHLVNEAMREKPQ